SDQEDIDLMDYDSANALAGKLAKLSPELPAVADRIASAKSWAAQRRQELEQAYDIVPANDRRQGEPVKLPGLSDEDERWYQETYAHKKP
ncbi:MAG: hypothetical protein JWN70_6520, partial [Planctomycetaceae bacterium]|nr:hypothetical protein [Planctomycetaceae bacterium]